MFLDKTQKYIVIGGSVTQAKRYIRDLDVGGSVPRKVLRDMFICVSPVTIKDRLRGVTAVQVFNPFHVELSEENIQHLTLCIAAGRQNLERPPVIELDPTTPAS